MDTGIFISYRRQDTIATAGRLYDRLVRAFGRKTIFMDVDQIPVGVDFVKHIESELEKCKVLLALIGPDWLQLQDGAGTRRLLDPHDLVANEIGTALRRGINVIPVLIDGALMPTLGDLPDPLKPLVRRNAAELRNTQFGVDAEHLVERIAKIINKHSRTTKRKYTAIGMIFLVGTLVVAFILFATWLQAKKVKSVEACGVLGRVERGLAYSGVYTGVIVESGQSGASVELKLVREENSVRGDYFRAGICGGIVGEVDGNRMNFSWNWADASGRGMATQNGDSLSGTSGFKDAAQGAGTFILFLRKAN